MAGKQVTKGTTAAFEVLFREPDGTPLVPVDPASYPQVAINDPDGTSITSGIGTDLGGGKYRFTWFVAADSPQGEHTIQWNMLTANNVQREIAETFTVIGQTDLVGDLSSTYLTYKGRSERLISRWRQPPLELDVVLTAPDGSTASYAKTDLTEVSQDNHTVFYVDTPAISTAGCYQVVWASRDTLVSPSMVTVQQLRVPNDSFWQMAPSLRMLIDKAQKSRKAGSSSVLAYTDSDLFEYFERGMDRINSATPITAWNLANFPASFGFGSYLLAAAGYWGILSQSLADGELAFNSSGQTVTLEVDHGAVYDSVLTKLETILTEEMPKTKLNMLRRTSVGSINVRPFSYGLTSAVFKVRSASGGNGQVLSLMSRIGLV